MKLQSLIDGADYQLKYEEVSAKMKGKEDRLVELAEAQNTRKDVKKTYCGV